MLISEDTPDTSALQLHVKAHVRTVLESSWWLALNLTQASDL
jgi:hypothetical protein